METEILKGPNLRVTTEAAQVGKTRTAIAGLGDLALSEGKSRVGLMPQVMIAFGLIAGLGLVFLQGSIPGGTTVSLMALAGAIVVYRHGLLHQVRARRADGSKITLYRTQRLADARIFHAAILKALELRQPPA